MDPTKIKTIIEAIGKELFVESEALDNFGTLSIRLHFKANKKMKKICSDLREQLHFDWIEGITFCSRSSQSEMSYFFRSRETGNEIRLLLPLEKKLLKIQSVSEVFPMARVFEREVEELYGVEFLEPQIFSFEIPNNQLFSRVRIHD